MRRLEAIGSGVSEVAIHLIAFGNLQQEEPRFGFPSQSATMRACSDAL